MSFIRYIESQQNLILSKMSGYFDQLSANYQLIAHQTFNDSAASIMKTGFGKNGLQGTALLVSPQQIIQTASTMFGIGQTSIHKGSNSLVVFAFPRQIMQQYNIRDMLDIDDHLTELNSQGKIPIIGLPQQYIVGYFYNGQFFANGKFNPDAKLLII
jgi:hypothetical protein